MGELNNREQELVALGAAVACNCMPCIEYHVPEARNAGLSDIQINEALKIADKVRQVPARMVLQTALARIGESPDNSANAAEGGCGCGGSTQHSESGCGT